jgi:hypothetical protein
MPSNTVIELVSLDPNTNKQSFINYLQSQPRFKGYDFAGADMNVLLDLFMINEFRFAFFLNMAISEGFLDSAQLFDSVKSHAKDLNYTPNSMSSAQANVTVNFTATGESQPYIIPKGSTFAAQVKNQNFTFTTDETIICASANNNFSFTTDIFEGIYVKDSYIYSNTSGPFPRYSITNANVDLSSVTVTVLSNNSVLGQSYNLVDSLLDLDSNSYVFFMQCSAANGNYEIMFGDNIFGSQPQGGSLVIFDYRITTGQPANGAGLFNIGFDPSGANELTGPVTVTTNQIALGGAPAENIETTRFRAPRYFQTQERCIVPSDYEIVLEQQFPEINAVNAYGGETLTPPQFGKVVIAINISNVVGLPNSKVSEYTAFIKGRNPLSIQPIFVAAQNMYVSVNSTVKYNINVTAATESLMETIVANAIAGYNDQNLDNFDVTFYYSQFTQIIQNADPSIISNLTEIELYQKITPSQSANNYLLTFSIPLVNDIEPLPTVHSNAMTKTLSSTNFMYLGNLSQLEDDGNGTIRIVNLSGNNLTLVANVGTINYANGIVQLANFSCDSFSGDNLLVYVTPAEDDFSSTQNIILSIEPSQTVVNAVAIAI